jgi:hypothetical protein
MARPAIPFDQLTPVGNLLVNMQTYQDKQQPSDTSDCIEWTGPTHPQGYGMIGAWRMPEQVKIMATTHRVAGRIKWGRELDPKEMVIHTCSNPACVNPDHLILGDRYVIHQVMVKNNRYEQMKPRRRSVKP